ncbi:hypothetical protein Q674_13120 [Acinetobacter sp. COS3]|uniref:hypothetical protein n=1 Tax=Acinetobacter sp. COS3 TaxID=1397525 RepID=UPI0003B82CD3|nr:hypothetical protein [Acinetobacter sp. COS3]ERS01378.1 hypothetical protein Q674_13120 [Acinetobacter sp. COS3]
MLGIRIFSFFILSSIFNVEAGVLTSLKKNTDITDILNKEIQSSVSTSLLEIPSGKYLIDATKSIQVRDNLNLKLQSDTELIVIPNNQKNYSVFQIHNAENVRITGGIITGDRYTHLDTTGEWGMGIEIKDSQNIFINNMSINEMWGDAIYIGSKGKNSNYNITLKNIKINENRRQGISIISVDTLNAEDIIISNTKGKSPMNGVDIEPNNHSNILKNINFLNLISFNNFAAGFEVSLKKYGNSKNLISINLKNYTDHGSRFGIKISNIPSKTKGYINIEKASLKNNKTSNLCFKSESQNKLRINITKLKHDKDYVKLPSAWCDSQNINKNLKIEKLI